MNVRKINQIFSYGLFLVGALKIILVILILLQLNSNIAHIFNGGNVSSNYNSNFSTAIGFAQIILAIGSIIMIIINTKKSPEVIPGYLWGLGAILIEIFTPRMLAFFMLFTECGMYMKAGTKIRNTNPEHEILYKTTRKMVKNTDWFYSDENQELDTKRQKRMAKLKEELDEWKKLLDSGEIDEETYNEETNKLIEKEKRKIERMK